MTGLLHLLAGPWALVLLRVASASEEDSMAYVDEWANNPNCTLKVLFLTYEEPYPEDELYVTGFNFWVNNTNEFRRHYSQPGELRGCMRVDPYFDNLVLEEGAELDSGSGDVNVDNVSTAVFETISQQVFGWRAQGIRFVILGVDFDDCSLTRGFLRQVGLHHIAVNVKDWFIFSRHAVPSRLWGVGSAHTDTLNGLVDITARHSTRGVCVIADEEGGYVFSDLLYQAEAAFDEVGVDTILRTWYASDMLNLSSLAMDIADAGCDILIALLSSTSDAAILHQELAILQAPLIAEFIWPELNTTVWKELGQMGEHVLSATEWHHDADFPCDVFYSTSDFVQLYRQWVNETLREDRVPTVPEASSVAAGTLIWVALMRLWDGERFTSFDEPPSHFFDTLGLDLPVDAGDQFNVRVAETIAHLSTRTFWGILKFDQAGRNVGHEALTLQYFQDTTVPVHPRSVSSRPPILPMDSFEARHGCPAGTFTTSASGTVSNSWSTAGLRCANCSRLQYQNESNQTQCLSCLPGQVSEEGATSCEECPPGQYRLEGQDECTLCQWGEFTSSGGATQCDRCPAGRFANDTGQSECQVCPPGRYAQEPGGRRECSPCGLGFSTNNNDEQGLCTACEENSYAEEFGSPVCTPCPDTFGTERIATDNRSKCLCRPGSYWHKATVDSEPSCVQCEDALLCDGWSADAPGAKAGYSVGLPHYKGAEPSYIVLCASTVDCPGGLEPGTCPEGHKDDRSCAECEDGWFKRSRGGCYKCEGVEWYEPVLMILLLACLVAVVLYGLRFAENNVPAESVVNITAVTGIVLTTLQILSVFRFIQVEWPEPIGLFHFLYSTLTHPLEIFSSAGCVLSINSAFHNYLMLMSMWPAAALLIFGLFKFAGVFSKYYRIRVTTIQIIQIEGMLVLLFYTSISMFSLIPWQCERNPDGTSSVAAYRQVLCWTGGVHAGMIALSCVAISIFIVGFLSLIAWATYQYPIKVTRPSGVKFLLKFRWIFSRFEPHKHYYGLIYCSRNLLVTILPVIFVDNVPVQFLLIASILQCSLIFQCSTKPWVTGLANRFDAASTVLLILLSIVGSLLISPDAKELAFLLSVFTSIIFTIFGLALLAVLAHNLYKRLSPRKEFAFFLCHHKVGAAVLARWVKIELQLRNQGHVFLDSDELNRLDNLFHVVGYETENFVVLLTNETLSRIWCAGEITTALRRRVRVVCIACSDYEEPTDDFITNLGKIWTDAQVAEVSRQGVSLAQIQEAFAQLRLLPKIRHDRGASFQKQMMLIDTLMARGRGAATEDLITADPVSLEPPELEQVTLETPNPTLSSGVTGTMTRTIHRRKLHHRKLKAIFKLPTLTGHVMDHQRNLMVGDLDDPEAFLVSRVLQVQLQQVLQSGIYVASRKIHESLEQVGLLKPQFMIAVLTAGVLSRPSFAVILAKVCMLEHPPTFVPVIADDKFVFPDEMFWADLERGGVVDPQVLLQHQVSIHDVLQAYKTLFVVISKRFSSHGSEKIQLTQVKEIADLWPLSRAKSSHSSGSVTAQV